MLLYIEWNVDPEIVSLGSFSLRWYSLLFATGFIVGYGLVKKMFIREKIDVEWLDKLLIAIVLGTVIGARLGHCLFYDFDYYMSHPLEMLLPVQFDPFRFTGYRGLASHGGAIGIIIALWYFSKKVSHRSILWVLDRVVVPTAFAGMCIRLGNLMNSEILGDPTNVPWAFIFESVDPIPRHPAQLYEAIFYLLIFIFLNYSYWNRNVHKKEGWLFGMFFILIFGARFLVEFVKNSQGGLEEFLGIMSTGQWLSIPFVLAGLYFVYKSSGKKA